MVDSVEKPLGAENGAGQTPHHGSFSSSVSGVFPRTRDEDDDEDDLPDRAHATPRRFFNGIYGLWSKELMSSQLR